jgi:cation diffusion facilitator CzcD-associated flavoprotein CzcO
VQEPERSTSRESFDAVVVCNGHYSDARRAKLPGSLDFPGKIVHSHSYRDNKAFAGLTVVVIGASASGEDICREIALTAEKVGLPGRPWHMPMLLVQSKRELSC